MGASAEPLAMASLHSADAGAVPPDVAAVAESQRMGLACGLVGDHGSAVVFVSNLFTPRSSWSHLVPQAAEHHRVLTYDLRNQGGSGDAADGPALQGHIDDLCRLLDCFGIERAWLVGTSLSTLICREFALQHPERTVGMVLAGPAFGPFGAMRRDLLIKSWLDVLSAQGMGGLFRYLYCLMLSDRAVQCHGTVGYLALREAFIGLHASPARLARSLAAFHHVEEHPDRLRAIECPVLLITGDADFMTGAAVVEMISMLFRRAQHAVIPGAGHLLYVDAPSRFGRLLLDFIDSCSSSQGIAE